jgi:hypothetical protein
MTDYDVFVSHASRPSPFVREFIEDLVNWLRLRGLTVFLDLDSMASRVRILPALEEAIRHSSSAIYVMTRRAQSSAWVTFELQAFNDHQQKGRFPIFGLRFDDSCMFPPALTWERKYDITRASDPQQIADDIEACLSR